MKQALLLIAALAMTPASAPGQQVRVELAPEMVTNEAAFGDPSGLVDEQREIIGPPVGTPTMIWKVDSQHNSGFPVSAHLDLGAEKNLASLWLFDTHNNGGVVISAGSPGNWTPVANYDCGSYMKWAELKLDVTTRYLRITRQTPGAQFTEIALYEHSPAAHREMLARKAAEEKAAAEQESALAKAREEALKRPLVEMAPYGKLSLVDEIDCAGDGSGHLMREAREGSSRIDPILGRRCRVLAKTEKESNHLIYRIGRMKLLRPGAAYVLALEYPEDAPRSMVVINTGNESARGFHTGTTLGDALHPKYVNNHNESIDVPLSGRYESWSLLFRLHDRFPEQGLLRGDPPRPLAPADGFDVTIAQFSAANIPLSAGAAVATIKLYEVVDPDQLAQPVTLPPTGLPQRHLFWREEMSDGILADRSKNPDEMGVRNRLDWFRHKAALMSFLGMNTYSKDLLEFGACQHWDPGPGGGNDWVHHASETKDLWAGIVRLMGEQGHNILPYYEYSGSKGGKQCLGYQRRAKPLTRDDAYTHIKWIENANADITDPATLDDFRKMLDLTVINLRRDANFAGIWLRPRSQLPVSFSDDALKRFQQETGRDGPVTRELLRKDKQLYAGYIGWWQTKRRGFLVAVRDHLRDNGVKEAKVLFTGCPGEPGPGLRSWEPTLATDRPDLWTPVLARPEHRTDKDQTIQPITVNDIVNRDLYLTALLAPGLNWGDWEIHHAEPADDPQHYKDTEGVLFSHPFNRNYTVSSPKTMDAFRSPAGLALVRHHTLNENMMFDRDDKGLLGYFVADIERAGPFCMMAEAIAMATGDPTMIGYLVGSNYGRGFPQYVRNFNANFLALPALPSTVATGVVKDPNVVVRKIDAGKHGTYLAVIHTGMKPAKVRLDLPPDRKVHDTVTGQLLDTSGGPPTIDMHPMQLLSLRVD